MKLLSISDGKGYFLSDAGEQILVDKIAKEDLLRLVELTLSSDCQMDDYDPLLIHNQAHQIIYQNIWSRLCELALKKKQFLDESKRLYLSEYERYKSDPPSAQDVPVAECS